MYFVTEQVVTKKTKNHEEHYVGTVDGSKASDLSVHSVVKLVQQEFYHGGHREH